MTHPTALVTLALALMTPFTPLASGPARAETTLLSGPNDFSGEETLVNFDDLGAGFGAEVPVAGGVDFVLDHGGSPRFLTVIEPREFGPQGTGSINNFFRMSSPFPDLHVLLPESIQRVGFEMRINHLDTVTVGLFSKGEPLGEVTVPSRGNDQFYFYGFENALGFDEVVIDVGAVVGTLSLDNLSYESSEGSAELLSCEGLRSMPEIASLGRGGSSQKRWRRRHHWKEFRRHMKVRLLQGRLLDAEGLALTGADLAAAPTVRVLFTDTDAGDSVDVTDAVLDGASDAFQSTEQGDWWIALPRRGMREGGNYEVTMESGDESEYVIEPTCSRSIVRLGHRHHRCRRHRRDDD